MSAYTKQAIKNSFLKLLNERPLSRVTVKAIVEDCGINRNTFYYHFADIPPLRPRSSPNERTALCGNTPIRNPRRPACMPPSSS